MAQQLINIGAAPNDRTGDTARAAGAKINLNFSELYGLVAEGGGGGSDFSGNYNDLTNKPTLGTASALDYGTTALKVVRLDADAKLPAVDGSQLTNLATGLTDISNDASPELGGDLILGTYKVGDALPADLTKLSEITATSTEINYLSGVTSSIQTQLTARITKASYDANTILKADTDDSPVALTLGESTLLGRLSGGSIAALGVEDVRTLLNVADGSTPDMTGSEISSALLTLATEDLEPLANAILDSVASLPAVATFQDWRDGISYSRVLTPAFWYNLFAPAAVTYAATTTIDYTDNAEGDIDTGKCRTLEPIITLTGDLTLAFNGITGSLVGRTIPVLLINGGDVARTLTLTGTANGITIAYAGGVVNPGIGSLTEDWLKVNVWFKSATEGFITGFSRSA